MRRFIRFACVILVVSMFLVVPAQAAEQASHFFASHSCYLWEVSDSAFQVCFNVTAVDAMDTLGASEIIVQRSADGDDWDDVATYYDFYGYNRSNYSEEITYSSVESGYYYRARVTFYAENDNGVGEYTSWTSSFRY